MLAVPYCIGAARWLPVVQIPSPTLLPSTSQQYEVGKHHPVLCAHHHISLRWTEDVVSSNVIDEKLGISVSSHFDSGNVDVRVYTLNNTHTPIPCITSTPLRSMTHPTTPPPPRNTQVLEMTDPLNIRLRIHPDPFTEEENCEHFQWFYYRVAGAKQKPLRMTLVNAGSSSYPEGWHGYKARASYDRKTWFMVPTEFDEGTGQLIITHTPERSVIVCVVFVCVVCVFCTVAIFLIASSVWHAFYACICPHVSSTTPTSTHTSTHPSTHTNTHTHTFVYRDIVFYAYFEPYTYEEHQNFIAAAQNDDRVCLKVLGVTHDGHDIELLRVGRPAEGKKKVWMIARQHPGETMAEFYVEGFVKRLIDADDALARKVCVCVRMVGDVMLVCGNQWGNV